MKQNQHKVPRVYLRKFGYKSPNNQWKVSVIRQGDFFTRQKSIESFTAETNFFDIQSDDVEIRKAFENLNCDLENEYNRILKDIEKDGKLSDKSYVYLMTLVANLICRSDLWRGKILFLLNSKHKTAFLHFTIGHISKSKEEFIGLPEEPFFKALIEMPAEEAVNRVLIFFADHILFRLKEFEIVIIKSQPDKPWVTSTNPIVTHNRVNFRKREQFTGDSEFYFPLSPEYLAYIHYKGSSDKKNKLRHFPTNVVQIATPKENINLQKILLNNPSEYIIFPGEFNHKSEIGFKLKVIRLFNKIRWQLFDSIIYLKIWFLHGLLRR
jgi:hypothetical protein